MEIERKFLLSSLPPITPYQIIDVYQGYLSIDPEVRVRSWEVLDGEDKGHKDYMLTIKGNGTLAREEIETYISEEFFNKIVAFIGHPLIHKEYYRYRHNGHTVECSVVDQGSKTWFIYGEVEFDSEEAAERYEWEFPETSPIDVTYESKFKMKNYWQRTRVDVDERVIKGFDFPTFDEWEKNKREYHGQLGAFKCSISTFSWGAGEHTYMLAIANANIPLNIYVDKIIQSTIVIDPKNVEELRRWYETSVQEAQRQWREYIQKNYLS